VRTFNNFLGLALIAGLLGCGPSGGDGGDGSDGGTVAPGTLRIAPGNVTLSIENGVAATQAYSAIYRDDDGDDHDVTDETSFGLALPSLGTFSGSTLTTSVDRAGRTTVTGNWDGNTASADLTIMLTHVIVTEGAPGNSDDIFDGATTGGNAPGLVYPNPGIIVPPNLSTIEFHFTPGASNDLFKLTFIGSLVNLEIYLVCTTLGSGCMYEPDQDTWDLLATAARGEEAMFYTVSGLSQASPSTMGVSDTNAVTFAQDDLLGGIYYWAAGAGAIMRYDFGRRGQTAETFLNVPQTGATTCVGCHALSRDGSNIAVGLDIPGPAGVETYTVATKQRLWAEGGGPIPGSGGANFFAYAPDNSQILLADGVSLKLFDAQSGTGGNVVIDNATMPDWSPDGDRVVFARNSTAIPFPSPGVDSGSIHIAAANTWNGQAELVPSSLGNNYYPAFTPDSSWVIYNRSDLGDSFDAGDAEVWIVSANGGTPIRLEQASPEPGGDSWPKVAPFTHNYGEGQVMWITFASRRAYGLRPGGTAQIWMVGIDPARAAQGLDPSFAAFWLPFQDIASGNHIAQWVEEIDRQPCQVDEECATGEFCEDGFCVPYVE
jgi:hypothetical protein